MFCSCLPCSCQVSAVLGSSVWFLKSHPSQPNILLSFFFDCTQILQKNIGRFSKHCPGNGNEIALQIEQGASVKTRHGDLPAWLQRCYLAGSACLAAILYLPQPLNTGNLASQDDGAVQSETIS